MESGPAFPKAIPKMSPADRACWGQKLIRVHNDHALRHSHPSKPLLPLLLLPASSNTGPPAHPPTFGGDGGLVCEHQCDVGEVRAAACVDPEGDGVEAAGVAAAHGLRTRRRGGERHAGCYVLYDGGTPQTRGLWRWKAGAAVTRGHTDIHNIRNCCTHECTLPPVWNASHLELPPLRLA